MEIYVVQQGDTIVSIAAKYGVTVNQIVINNGLENVYDLVPGQTLVIVSPSKTYIVQEGDSLQSIASNNGVSVMQLLRNNPFLSKRYYIYPGEALTISFDTKRDLSTNGFVYPFINEEILQRTLPYLTYISIFNYRTSDNGSIITFRDDSYIIQQSMAYGTMPLLMISSLSPSGEPDPMVEAGLIYNTENQIKMSNNLIEIMYQKGFLGVNVVVSLLNQYNQNAYLNFLTYLYNRLKDEGFLLFITLNPNITKSDSKVQFDQIDYNSFGQICYRLTFLQYYWGVNTDPPAPVTSIKFLNYFMEYIVTVVLSNNISIGTPMIAYDWALPYIPNKTVANSLTLDAAINLASDTGSSFVLDEESQTPYFKYNQSFIGDIIEHIVWSIDARTMDAINNLIIKYDILGSGIWNVMVYNQQFWTVINSTYNIVKLIPDQLE